MRISDEREHSFRFIGSAALLAHKLLGTAITGHHKHLDSARHQCRYRFRTPDFGIELGHARRSPERESFAVCGSWPLFISLPSSGVGQLSVARGTGRSPDPLSPARSRAR